MQALYFQRFRGYLWLSRTVKAAEEAAFTMIAINSSY